MTLGSLALMSPRRATGSIEPHAHADGRTVSYYLRVRSKGQRFRINLGNNHQGWSMERAQVELDKTLERIERGTWQPPLRTTVPRDQPAEETFHVLVSRWWARREGELAQKTRTDYWWRIDHLLRHVAHVPVGEFDTRTVDELRAALQARGLGARSTNMVLGLLAQVLEDAVESKALDSNPARGRRRRVKEPVKRRSFLEPDMVVDLLDEAGEWERGLPAHQRYGRRALLAFLILAGPRITEAVDARRGRLDVHGGAVVLGMKTEAGTDRRVDLTAFLLGELRAHLAAVPARIHREHAPALPIFPTLTGGRLNASNVRTRLLAETVMRANERRAAEGKMLLPHVTPHGLRRTFASLCFFAGRDPRTVMAWLGHTDPRMTLSVYAQTMQRRTVDRDLVWNLMRFPDEEEGDGERSNLRAGLDRGRA